MIINYTNHTTRPGCRNNFTVNIGHLVNSKRHSNMYHLLLLPHGVNQFSALTIHGTCFQICVAWCTYTYAITRTYRCSCGQLSPPHSQHVVDGTCQCKCSYVCILGKNSMFSQGGGHSWIPHLTVCSKIGRYHQPLSSNMVESAGHVCMDWDDCKVKLTNESTFSFFLIGLTSSFLQRYVNMHAVMYRNKILYIKKRDWSFFLLVLPLLFLMTKRSSSSLQLSLTR